MTSDDDMSSDDLVRFACCKHTAAAAYLESPNLQAESPTITNPPHCLRCTLEIASWDVLAIMNTYDVKHNHLHREAKSPCCTTRGWPSTARHGRAFDDLVAKIKYDRQHRDTEVAGIWHAIVQEWNGATRTFSKRGSPEEGKGEWRS